MLVYDRAYGYNKYMSWVSIFLYDMYELPEKHPGSIDLHQYVMGFFGAGHGWGGGGKKVPCLKSVAYILH